MMLFSYFWLIGALPFLLVISNWMAIFRTTNHIALPGGFHILLDVILHIPFLC